MCVNTLQHNCYCAHVCVWGVWVWVWGCGCVDVCMLAKVVCEIVRNAHMCKLLHAHV